MTAEASSEDFRRGRKNIHEPQNENIVLGADRMEQICLAVGTKRIGLIANSTSLLSDGRHLIDAMIERKLNVRKIFAPEHGFRGTDDAGATVRDGIDSRTGIPITSVYGRNMKPTASQLADIDVLVFDIQDVGTRFYTYISTLHYAMEAAAETGKDFVVLDRPNPNDFIDGPVRKEGFVSFVGVDPIPLLHGLTVGELAQMINGEGWLRTGPGSCRLTVVEMLNWRHGEIYILPVKPSPNLPNHQAIRLYPSLCFFEGTSISVGRGTKFPFQQLGHPNSKYGDFTFMPKSLVGFDTNPMYKNTLCHGIDLRAVSCRGGLTLRYLIDFYRKSGCDEKSFFKNSQHFDRLAGTDTLRHQIVRGMNEDEIRATWQDDLDTYKTIRLKYLLYGDYP